jgi:hypothetical protein
VEIKRPWIDFCHKQLALQALGRWENRKRDKAVRGTAHFLRKRPGE